MKLTTLVAIAISVLSTSLLAQEPIEAQYSTFEKNLLVGLNSGNQGLESSCAYFLGEIKSKKAINQLELAGYTNCFLVEGGINAFASAGIELSFSQGGVISLERQVRIAAWLLIITGTILGATINSYFYCFTDFM